MAEATSVRMWVMVSGPYRTGAADEAARRENLEALNRAAFGVFSRGHIPIVGVNLALPIIEAAGMHRYDDIMMPVALAAADRCDAVLRIGGESSGADLEVACFVSDGKPVFSSVDDIPVASEGA